MFSKDMRDLIDLLNAREVRYALVGGHAVNYYGYVRATQDVDLLIYPSRENSERVMDALEAFGFGEAGIPQEYFERTGSAIHLGVEPNRIDLITHLKGIENDRIFSNVEQVEIEGVRINVISYEDLVAAKELSDRTRDQADAEELRRIQDEKDRS